MNVPEPPALARDAEPRLRLIGRPAGDAADRPAPRLAVIVSADVVDFTRHMAEDEAGTHARFALVRQKLIRPGVGKHGGRIFKDTGDGFMAVFWSAVEAVRFAVDFQGANRRRNHRRAPQRRLEFRVGVNLGDVILEPDDVFGHSVNVAARLQSLADPGGVLVSQAVFVSVRDPRLAFEDAGELALKNLKEPVRGFRAKPAGLKAK
jgi:adenylate cyclase